MLDAVNKGSPVKSWTDVEGHSISAEFRGLSGGVVHLLRVNAMHQEVALERLSAADQEYIQEQIGTSEPKVSTQQA